MEQENERQADAKELWDANRGYDAGLAISEAIPIAVQPRWAARILRLVLEKSGVKHRAINRVLSVAENSSMWIRGHRVFSQVRDVVLRIDRKQTRGLSEYEELLSCVLALAELVAKVTYNATDPPDEFDEDSGACLVSSLRAFVEVWHDEQFSANAWQVATDQGANKGNGSL